jgi:8-oxo-dGTP pyrophosphatase MutT (NUDIX family)
VSTSRPGTRGDGDGWVECALGHRHWGLYGAAGLLLRRATGDGDEVLLQHRATWSHHGGTWGLLGGARQREENAVTAALREAGEEGGLDAGTVSVHGRFDDAHGRWSYATVLGTTGPGTVARATGGESIEVAWVAVDQVPALPLHPGFAQSWPLLRRALQPLTVVVDAANVVGSRPDGWWRDRAGATVRLLERVAGVARGGVSDARLPDEVDRPPLSHWWPRWVVVVEGAARAAAREAPPDVEVVTAPASGDDAIVETVRSLAAPTLVVTADRELRRRSAGLGAASVGPAWLHDLE